MWGNTKFQVSRNGKSQTESDRCSGVGKRAGTVNSDYLGNARRADIEYSGHDRNSPLDGPIARRLKEYRRVKAFVVGPRAEMSRDLHSRINCISERAAEARWRGMLATDVIHAKGVIKTILGILGARANAECLEDRLGIMVGDGKAAFGRRRSADAANGQPGGIRRVQQALLLRRRRPRRWQVAHLSAAAAGAGGAAVRSEPQSPYRRR